MQPMTPPKPQQARRMAGARCAEEADLDHTWGPQVLWVTWLRCFLGGIEYTYKAGWRFMGALIGAWYFTGSHHLGSASQACANLGCRSLTSNASPSY